MDQKLPAKNSLSFTKKQLQLHAYMRQTEKQIEIVD